MNPTLKLIIQAIVALVFLGSTFYAAIFFLEGRYETKKDATAHKTWAVDINKLWGDRYNSAGAQLKHDVAINKVELQIRFYESLLRKDRNDMAIHRKLTEAEELKKHLMKGQ